MLERLRAIESGELPALHERPTMPPEDPATRAAIASGELPMLAEERAAFEANPARAELARLRGSRDTGGPVDAIARHVGEPFNRGLVNFIAFPTDLLEGLTGLDLGTDSLRMHAENLGFTLPEGERETGFVARGSEILGGSVLPAAGIMTHGRRVLQTIPAASRTIWQRLTAGAAQSPKAGAVGDIVSSYTAGMGGEVAKQFTDDPNVIALGELAGGFSPLAITSGPGARALRAAPGAIRDLMFPFTQSGGTSRAARRLQSLAGDPGQAAARIGAQPDLSPARQTGDRRLLGLEQRILDESPAADDAAARQLREARARSVEDGDMGGDPAQSRRRIRESVNQVIEHANAIAQGAARKAFEAVRSIYPGGSPRDVSRTAREALESAYNKMRDLETRMWGSLDQKAPANVANAKAALQAELAARSAFEDPADIPRWLRQALKDETEDLPEWAQEVILSGRGHLVAPPRQVRNVSVGDAEPSTFGDVHAIRKRVGQEIRDERAKPAPNRNKVRILQVIESALLDDMTASGQEGLDAAREFSRLLHQRFTTGPIARVLGYERAGGVAVDAGDTLSEIINGRHTATAVRQMLEAAPQTRPQLERYLKSLYLAQAVDENGVNIPAARRFAMKWGSKGMFEIFPNLQSELDAIETLQQGARRLGLRAENVKRLAHHSTKSRAALYLNAPPGEEMAALFRSGRPTEAARSLIRRVQGDRKAVQGLKTSFVEELFRQSSAGFDEVGDTIISGARFGKLLSQYQATARALGMTDAELGRLGNIATRLRLIDAKPKRLQGRIIDDAPAMILDLMARWVGARAGAHAGGQMGSQLVLAQAGSQRMRRLLGRLTRDRATEILVAAHSDPELYRALLTRTDAPAPKVDAAVRRLNAWMAGTVPIEDDEPESPREVLSVPKRPQPVPMDTGTMVSPNPGANNHDTPLNTLAGM